MRTVCAHALGIGTAVLQSAHLAVVAKCRVVVLVMGVATGAAASAAEPPISDIIAAGKRLDTMMAESLEHGTMPRRTDPAVADVLSRMSDTQVLAQHRFAADDFETLTGICNVPLRAALSYTYFGVEREGAVGADPAEVASTMQRILVENSDRFGDELILLAPALVRCMTIQTALIAEHLGALPAGKLTEVGSNGLRQTKMGAEALYRGGLSTLADERLAASDRERLRKELVLAAAPFTQMLPVAARLRVLASVIQVEKSAASDSRSDLETIRHTFAEARCDGLCTID